MSAVSSILTTLLVAAALVAPCDAENAPSTTASIVSTTVVNYHGFALDIGHDASIDAPIDAPIDVAYPALARQIAIVEEVDTPPAVKTFFASVPIRVEKNLPRPPGQFVPTKGGGYVRILPDGMEANRPILLHELLHAYHTDVIGRTDAQIAAAFADARSSSAYPAKFRSAHFLENDKEYFAVTASIYLFGPIQQPPFDCGVLKATQPDYLAFLAKHFGPHECR